MSSLSVAFYTVDGDNVSPGNIIVFGGSRDVEISKTSHDPRVAGIAIDPNIDAELTLTNFGWFPCSTFAVVGRVNCQVKGPITKGDCVVTSDQPGIGQKLDPKKFVHGCIVGKAMFDIEDDSVQLIEVAVGIR